MIIEAHKQNGEADLCVSFLLDKWRVESRVES